MTNNGIEEFLVASFLLGVRVADFANGKEVGSTPIESMANAIADIYDEKLTLLPSPAEVRLLFPGLEVREDVARDNREIERRIAQALVNLLLSGPH